MFCSNCGAQLPDHAKFCNMCGTPTGVGGPAPQAGARQQNFRQETWPRDFGPVYRQPAAPPVTGELLYQAEKVSRYNGGGAIGPVTGTGELYVYDDRLEFEKKTGDQRGYMLGPIVGAVIARNGAKKNPVDVYEFADIADVRTGKYAGMMGTLVLELRNGKKVSFVLGRGGKELAEEICDCMLQYL